MQTLIYAYFRTRLFTTIIAVDRVKTAYFVVSAADMQSCAFPPPIAPIDWLSTGFVIGGRFPIERGDWTSGKEGRSVRRRRPTIEGWMLRPERLEISEKGGEASSGALREEGERGRRREKRMKGADWGFGKRESTFDGFGFPISTNAVCTNCPQEIVPNACVTFV